MLALSPRLHPLFAYGYPHGDAFRADPAQTQNASGCPENTRTHGRGIPLPRGAATGEDGGVDLSISVQTREDTCTNRHRANFYPLAPVHLSAPRGSMLADPWAQHPPVGAPSALKPSALP